MSFCPDYIDFMDDSYEGEKYIESTAVEPEPMRDVVILSIEKYDEMKANLVKLGEDLEIANRDKEHCLDILKKIGLTEELVEHITPDTGKLMETYTNHMTLNTKIIFSFEMDDDWRV